MIGLRLFLPGEEVWVIGEHRSTGERKYYLSNLPADTPIKQLAGAIKARWVCEQAHQQLKEELDPRTPNTGTSRAGHGKGFTDTASCA